MGKDKNVDYLMGEVYGMIKVLITEVEACRSLGITLETDDVLPRLKEIEKAHSDMIVKYAGRLPQIK